VLDLLAVGSRGSGRLRGVPLTAFYVDFEPGARGLPPVPGPPEPKPEESLVPRRGAGADAGRPPGALGESGAVTADDDQVCDVEPGSEGKPGDGGRHWCHGPSS
jgi:hypothetical protein